MKTKSIIILAAELPAAALQGSLWPYKPAHYIIYIPPRWTDSCQARKYHGEKFRYCLLLHTFVAFGIMELFLEKTVGPDGQAITLEIFEIQNQLKKNSDT